MIEAVMKPEDQKIIGILQAEIAAQTAEMNSRLQNMVTLLENEHDESAMNSQRGKIPAKSSYCKAERLTPLQRQ